MVVRSKRQQLSEIDLRRIISFLLLRRWILLSLCIVVPLGFWFKFYTGWGEFWFNDYGAGVVYEIFWCLVVFLFVRPVRENSVKIAVMVFALTCVLEVLQLWHPLFLDSIRGTFPGSAILGTTFVWWDFPHYALGSSIGWVWMQGIIKLMSYR